jgi:hypothetical protein
VFFLFILKIVIIIPIIECFLPWSDQWIFDVPPWIVSVIFPFIHHLDWIRKFWSAAGISVIAPLEATYANIMITIWMGYSSFDFETNGALDIIRKPQFSLPSSIYIVVRIAPSSKVVVTICA